MNIILIGMPASGKSTIGRKLARMAGYRFLDLDRVIEEKEGRKLQEIIAESGLQGFREAECSAAASLGCQRTVIATGGSVVYCEEAMQHLRRLGRVVYLAVELDEIKKRLWNPTTRGIVIREGQTFEDLYHERTPLYEHYAMLTIPCRGRSSDVMAEEIMLRLGIRRRGGRRRPWLR